MVLCLITDCKHQTGKINLPVIDASAKLGGNQALKLPGTSGAALTGVAGQLHDTSASGHTHQGHIQPQSQAMAALPAAVSHSMRSPPRQAAT